MNHTEHVYTLCVCVCVRSDGTYTNHVQLRG